MKPSYNFFTAPKITTTFPSGAQYFDREVSWHQTLNCSALIKGNGKAPNPWSYSYLRVAGLSGRYIYAYPSSAYPQSMTEGQLTGGAFASSLDRTYYEDNAYNAALDRLNGKVRGSLDLATSLAEAGQTVKMLNLVDRYVTVSTDMANSYRREVGWRYASLLSKSRFRKELMRWQSGLAKRHPREYRPRPIPKDDGFISKVSNLGANGWLEFTYGLSPLLSDISGVANQAVRHCRNAMVIRAKSEFVISEDKNVSVSYGGYTGTHPCKTRGSSKVEISVRMLPNWDKGLNQWTSFNLLGIAYELLTLSFVLDWFLNVGNYLRNLETSLLYDNSFSSGYVSVTTKYSQETEASGVSTTPWGDVYVLNGAKSSLTSCAFNRSLLYSYPTPRAPRFQADLGWRRLLSAASLLRGLLK